MSYIPSAMSGWGCRHQLDDRCLLLRKDCKPGIPGCVLYKKVTFINEVEPMKKARARPSPGTLRAPASPRKAGRGGKRRGGQ
jgi:hypothetical protein